MNFNEYQDKAETFATYDNVFYPYASLMVETAELVDARGPEQEPAFFW